MTDWWEDQAEQSFLKSEAQEENDALNALCQRLDRILSGKATLTVKSVGPKEIGIDIAATKSNAIVFNHTTINSLAGGSYDKKASLRDRLILTLAINIHELGHVHYTGHWENKIWEAEAAKVNAYAVKPAIYYFLNLFEDQRQELLEGIRHPKARDWQRITLMALIKKDKIHGNSLIMYWGRRHLVPREAIVEAEKKFTDLYGEANTTRIKAIITEFQTLVPDDTGLLRMWELAAEAHKMFGGKLNDTLGNCTKDKKAGPSVKPAEQREIADQAEKALEEFDKEMEQEVEDREAESSNPTDGSPQTNPDEQAGSDKGPADPSPDGSKAGGPPDQSVKEALEAFNDQVMDRLEEDIEDNWDALQDQLDGFGGIGDGGEGTKEMALDPRYLQDAIRLSRLFRNVTMDLNLKDTRKLKSGRLDIRRLATSLASNSNRMFKKRQRDLTDESKMAIAIMFDVSSSMHEKAELAMQASFTIAKGAELSGHIVQVEKFATECRIVKKWGAEKYQAATGMGMYGGGGTNPLPAILRKSRELERIGNAETINNKVLIIATDGGFEAQEQCKTQFKKLARQGVHVYLIGMGHALDSHDWNEETQTTTITKNGSLKFYEPWVEWVSVAKVDDLFGAMKELLGKLELSITQDIKRRMV